jgi:hypothetical protein
MSVKGEKYTSKKSMMKHEKSEGKAERFKEYGKKPMAKKPMKRTAKRGK